MTNPLLLPSLLPLFSKIKPKHVVPAITKALNDCYITIEKVLSQKGSYTWNNLHQEIMEANDVLERIFSSINHLNSVKNNYKLREAYEQALKLVSKYNTWIGHNEKLYKAYCNLHKNKYFSKLNTAQKRTIDNTLRNFKLSGINLSKEKQKRYSEIDMRLSKLSNQYSNNVLDATMGWSKLITNEFELDGVPKSVLEEIKEKDGYLLTLDASTYIPIVTYCNNQSIREEIYRAYITRASDQGPNAGKWDNSEIMVEILALRHELARLLGFKNHFHKSLITKMANDQNQVFVFLTNLIKYTRSQGKKELANLCSFIKKQFRIKKLQPWDFFYYSEKYKQYLYNISKEDLRFYFPENKVINGLFNIVKRVYGIFVKERYDVDVWCPEVRFFELYDEESNKLLGSFYLDIYTRKNKRSGAWMDICINQMRKSNGLLQKPVVYLTCNFSRPINNKPALFTHDEVITLFHEFGHGIHHMLTSIEVTDVSGINGIPQDAVEFSSQLMENWCWEPEALICISEHYKTGKELPKDILNKIQATKNYQSAIFILRQLEFSLFDFRIHTEFIPERKIEILKILTDIEKYISVIYSPSWGRFPHTFSHIFVDGYDAGYYGYLWANVLAVDAYSLFKRKGIFNRKIGKSFLKDVLTHGGSEDPLELFKRFLGREPKLDAILEHYGIKKDFGHC